MYHWSKVPERKKGRYPKSRVIGNWYKGHCGRITRVYPETGRARDLTPEVAAFRET